MPLHSVVLSDDSSPRNRDPGYYLQLLADEQPDTRPASKGFTAEVAERLCELIGVSDMLAQAGLELGEEAALAYCDGGIGHVALLESAHPTAPQLAN